MTLGAWLELHNGAFAREQHAAVLMAEFAQALAGTDKMRAAATVSSSFDDATEPMSESGPLSTLSGLSTRSGSDFPNFCRRRFCRFVEI
ncbi:hypothetical protein SAMN02745126_03618 [Enhydrobacter aerosaccus]|uniref:Uncharacterized protein n=1 Tax=Enhydrobacter aerosaccus TaxID=225324 RepID=A0A1T4R678_9HYPH|nr:hypothetical protein SAMN02745126_03618 [Enhydrobacter aerosaccus]